MVKKTPSKKPGDYVVGFGKPPASGRIKPGEVRNKHGRNGKPAPPLPDPYQTAMAQQMAATINGVTRTISAEAAMYMRHTAKALEGNDAAFRTLAAEGRSRRGAGSPPPTAEELAAAAAEEMLQEQLVRRLQLLLDNVAVLKKAGAIHFVGDRMVVGPNP